MPLALAGNGFEATLLPELGGSVAALDWRAPDGRTLPLLRRSDAAAMASGNPSNLACFPMVPFANRIGGSRFRFGGRDYELAPNRPPCPVAIHGFGLLSTWAVEEHSGAVARLVHRHDGAVFRYTAEQIVRLLPGRVEIILSVTHEGAEPMPYGIGLHPWLVRAPDTRLAFAAGRVFRPDADSLPSEPEAIGGADDFTSERPVTDALGCNSCFSGWNGTAEVSWPDRGLRLALSGTGALRNLHLYVPGDRPTFCLEPVSHVPDAHNHPDWREDEQLTVLAPGERLTGSLTLAPGLAPPYTR